MKKSTLLLGALGTIVLLGCGVFLLLDRGEPVIDGSSEEAFIRSLAAVRKPLRAEQRERLEEAMEILASPQPDEPPDRAFDPADTKRCIRETLAGKNAGQIIEAAGQRVARRQQDRRREMSTAIEDLQQQIESHEEDMARAKIAREKAGTLAVERSRFLFPKVGSAREALASRARRGVIELTVRNDTQQVVSNVRFHGVLRSPERAEPWAEGQFSYPVEGGLQPGESATWQLMPNKFSPWANVPRNRVDMILTVTAVGADAEDGKPIFDTQDTKAELEELLRLMQKLESLRGDLRELDKEEPSEAPESPAET